MCVASITTYLFHFPCSRPGTTVSSCFNPLPTETPALLLFPDRYVLVGSHHDNDRGGGALAVMNQLIAALTEQTKRGWVPDRTTVFCSWGGTALGNIGSYEWGKVSKHKWICFIYIVATGNCESIPVISGAWGKRGPKGGATRSCDNYLSFLLRCDNKIN